MAASFLALSAFALPGQAAPDRTMLPDAALVALEIADPPAAVRALLKALGPVPADLPATTRAQISLGLVGLSVTLGSTPERWAQRIAGGGAVVGWMPHRGKAVAVAITRPGDLVAASGWCERVLGRGHHDLVGEHLLLASAPGALPKLREHLDTRASRWAKVASAPAIVGQAPAIVRAIVDVGGLRDQLQGAWPGVAKLEPGSRWLLAPFVGWLEDATWARASLAVDDGIHIEATADASVRGREVGGLLVDVPRPLPRCGEDVVLSLRFERSLHRLFAESAKFLDEDGVLSLQEFLSIADGLDGPATSFVEDGLGGLGEPLDLLVFGTPPVEPQEERAPLLLPQFAFVTSIRGEQTEAMFTRMVRIFGTIVNAERQQQGKSAFLVRSRRGEDGVGRGIVAESRAWSGTGKPPLEQHLTPTIWFERGHVALASTQQAAIRAIDAACAAAPGASRGDRMRVHGPALAAVLRNNHRVLVMSRMLDEGELPEPADDYFRVLESVAAAIGVLEVSCTAQDEETKFGVTLRRSEEEPK